MADKEHDLPTAAEIRARRLESLRGRYEAGDHSALLQAVVILLDGANSEAVADWVRDAFVKGWLAWELGQARVLDEAFGIKRPPQWTQNAERKRALAGVAWSRVVRESAEGHSINRGLFDYVADELTKETGVKWNGTDVSDFYMAIEAKHKNLP
jgi:hypothetical protein